MKRKIHLALSEFRNMQLHLNALQKVRQMLTFCMCVRMDQPIKKLKKRQCKHFIEIIRYKSVLEDVGLVHLLTG